MTSGDFCVVFFLIMIAFNSFCAGTRYARGHAREARSLLLTACFCAGVAFVVYRGELMLGKTAARLEMWQAMEAGHAR